MKSLKFFVLTGAFFSLAIALVGAAPPGPNILFILTDDLGWGDLGVMYQISRMKAQVRSRPWEQTPNLDRMAAEGVRLTDHYCAAPVCAPSRASLLLGLSQGHANVRDNQFDKALEKNQTVATVLRQAGYATVAIGKWGLPGNGPGQKSPNTWPAYPTQRGFDAFFGYARHQDGHEHYPKEAPYTQGRVSKQVWDDATDITPKLDKCYTADLWTAWAKRWITEHARSRSGQPFFMYLAYDTPHAVQELPTQAYPEGGGLQGGVQWLGQSGHMISTASGEIDSWVHPDYRDATYDDDSNPSTPEVPWPNVYRRYATAVRRIDDAVGDILKLLNDLGLDRNTLVVFSSDNGPSIESYLPNEPLRADFFDSFGPFDGIKRDCWEGGLRVPTLARWPGHIPAGRVVSRPSVSYDWLRTLAEAAGVPPPARSDGVSLLPELTGQGVQHDRGYTYVEYYESGKTPSYNEFAPAHRGRVRGQMQVVRLGEYAGVRYNIQSQTDPFEIYRVTTDPQETNNLAASLPAVEARMKATVLQVRRPNQSAPRPYDNELVPSSPESRLAHGLLWKTYSGPFPWLPDFETLKPVRVGVVPTVVVDRQRQNDDFGLMFSGFLDIPRPGEYRFYLETDTRALLRLHDATVIEADYGYSPGTEVGGSIRLQAGLHPFRLYYDHLAPSVPSLKFSWSGPGISKSTIPDHVFQRSIRP